MKISCLQLPKVNNINNIKHLIIMDLTAPLLVIICVAIFLIGKKLGIKVD